MAILVDYRSVASASMMKGHGDLNVPDPVKKSFEILLGKIRFYNSEFREEFGELVLCNDSSSWRYKIFEHYKSQRKLGRINGMDQNPDDPMHAIYESIHSFWDIIAETGPYKCLRIRGAEGDDLLASIAMTPGKHLCISADKDISQLTRFPNVKFYNSIKKMMINNGPNFWHQLVVRGDGGDGVPNILSDDDTFMDKNKRQRQLRQEVVDKIVDSIDPEETIMSMKFSGIFSEQVVLNYRRNKRLIDLTQIPKSLRELVVQKFNEDVPPKRDLTNMLIALKNPQYIGRLNDFVPKRETIDTSSIDIF
ncbi:exonuclease [Rhizobium phage RHph_N34]|uniref:Ribonuclease H protein n=1 Tax=Rhizobium phage RHph_N34 TaxID=2509586 RepID=A0A7S5UYR0_9CAUD|nr:exonuclease [Rhizobium phage RHph_N34]QIG73806.1 ribonuclease H protein [Rhizobium phage RHph_N34]